MQYLYKSLFCIDIKPDSLKQTLKLEHTNSQRDQLLQYSHYIRMKPELDSLLVTQAADFFKVSC